MKSPEVFWNVVAGYNTDTWWIQVLLILAGMHLTIALYRNPSERWQRRWERGMKLYLAFAFAWMAVVFFFLRDPSPVSRFFAGPLFLTISLLFILDLRNPRHAFRLPVSGLQRAATLVWLLLVPLYPLASYLLGHRYPAITTPLMPCPLTVFTIALFSASWPAVNRGIYLFLLIWAMAALPKVFGLFNVYEDTILFLAGLYSISLWLPSILTR